MNKEFMLIALWGLAHLYPGADLFSQEPFWQRTNYNAGKKILSLATTPQGHILAGIDGDGGLLRSTDNGDSWALLGFDVETIQWVSVGAHGTIYVFAGYWWMLTGFYYSTDDGVSWTKATLPATQTLGINAFVSNRDGMFFFGQYNVGVHKSSDRGTTWSRNLGPGSALTLGINKDNELFAGFSTADPWRGSEGIYRTQDNGNTWVHLNLGLSRPAGINSIVTNSKGTMFALALGLGVLRSDDSGNTWTIIWDGPTQSDLPIAIDSFDRLFAATFSGVWMSNDDGENWQQVNSGLDDLNVIEFTSNAQGFTFAATNTGGLFRTTNPASLVEVMHEFPTALTLYPNYPNPFNAGTEIRYELPNGKTSYPVVLAIYDLQGRLIKQLVHAVQTPGVHSVIWEGTDFEGKTVPSQVYFYSLQMGELRQIRKLVLLK